MNNELILEEIDHDFAWNESCEAEFDYNTVPFAWKNRMNSLNKGIPKFEMRDRKYEFEVYSVGNTLHVEGPLRQIGECHMTIDTNYSPPRINYLRAHNGILTSHDNGLEFVILEFLEDWL